MAAGMNLRQSGIRWDEGEGVGEGAKVNQRVKFRIAEIARNRRIAVIGKGKNSPRRRGDAEKNRGLPKLPKIQNQELTADKR